LAGVHWHEPLKGFGRRSMALRQANQHPPPMAEGGIVCTACQIIRHAAAQPITGAATSQPGTSVFARLAPFLSGFRSHQPSALYGRAPPLPWPLFFLLRFAASKPTGKT